MRKLFSEVERIDTSVKRHGEPSFLFLDRSARNEFRTVRNLWEDWYSSYPDPTGDLHSRLTSNNDIVHLAAAFELFCFSLLRRLNCRVEVHPKLKSGISTTPDFLVTTPSDEKFYAEATVVSYESKEAVGARAQINKVIDALSSLRIQNFFLSISYDGYPKTLDRLSALKRHLSDWVSSLDYEEIRQRRSMHPEKLDLPVTTWKFEGCRLKIHAFPRMRRSEGDTGHRAIGAIMPPAQWSNHCKPLKEKLDKKAKKYGKLDHPLVLFANVLTPFIDEIDLNDAFLGEEVFVGTIGKDGASTRSQRRGNGFWRGSTGLRNLNVSAVVIANDLAAHNLSDRKVIAFGQPLSEASPSAVFAPLQRATMTKSLWYEHTEAVSISSLFGLSSKWPFDR